MRRLVLVLAVAAAACRSEERSKPKLAERGEPSHALRLSPPAVEAAGIEIAIAARASFRPSLAAGGFIQPDARRSVVVRSPGEGRVVRVAVDLGAHVGAGETLVVIESPDANAALLRQRASAARERAARDALGRAQRLLELEGISRGERDARQADAEASAAEAEAARRDLARLGLDAASDQARLTVTAPVAGRVLELSAVEGALTGKDSVLAHIADLSRVWALLEVAENEAAQVEVGGAVAVHSDAFPEQAFPGRVALLEPMLGESNGRARIRVVVDNASRALKPGQFVTARIPLAQPTGTGTAIPSEALQRLSGLTAVFVQTGTGTFDLRLVEIGRESAGRVEVLRGVRDGDQVVVRGAFALKTELLKSSLAESQE